MYSNKPFERSVQNRYSPLDIGGFEHACRVAHQARSLDEYYVGMCHDMIEDGYITAEELVKDFGLSDEHVAAVLILTRKKDNQTYAEYIQSIIDARKSGDLGSELAFRVKFYDIYDHLHPSRAELPRAKNLKTSHAMRYVRALEALVRAHTID